MPFFKVSNTNIVIVAAMTLLYDRMLHDEHLPGYILEPDEDRSEITLDYSNTCINIRCKRTTISAEENSIYLTFEGVGIENIKDKDGEDDLGLTALASNVIVSRVLGVTPLWMSFFTYQKENETEPGNGVALACMFRVTLAEIIFPFLLSRKLYKVKSIIADVVLKEIKSVLQSIQSIEEELG